MARIFREGTRWQRGWLVRLGATLVLLFSAHLAKARPFRVQQLPNGSVNGCNNCHVTPGGPRTPFGETVEQSFLIPISATGNVQWGPALAALDSDGDGRSNGQELLDPAGAWVAGQPNPGPPSLVRNPGAVDAPPGVPALPWSAIAMLAAGLSWVGASRLRRAFVPLMASEGAAEH